LPRVVVQKDLRRKGRMFLKRKGLAVKRESRVNRELFPQL
jgi:hypothetical protein